jgi:thiol-disulfide isomerase/thioredoxin
MKSTISFLAMLLFFTTAKASPVINAVVTISGITDKHDTVVISLFHDYFPVIRSKDAIVYKAPAIDGRFSLTIHHLVQPKYISVSLLSHSAIKPVLYLIEPGDDIVITVCNNQIAFSGRSAKKMQCQHELYALSLVQYTPGDPRLMTDFTPYTSRQWHMRKADSLYTIRKNIVDKYKPHLSPFAYKQLLLDCLGDVYYGQFNQAYGSLYGSVGETQMQEANAYRNYYFSKTLTVPGADYPLSRSYSMLALEKLKADIWVRDFFKEQKKARVALRDLLRQVQATYTGSLKEKMDAGAFLELFDKNDDAAGLLQQYLAASKQTRYRQLLVTMLNQKSPGTPVRYFEFVSIANNAVHLSDFLGKTIILNVWISTCYHCVELAAAMKPLKDSIKALTDVVLITVNVDKDPAAWLNAVERGIFTEKDNINLFTGGKGIEHPFMKYYNYVGMPAQMIIDKKGNLVTANPVRPADPLSTAKFWQQVKAAL